MSYISKIYNDCIQTFWYLSQPKTEFLLIKFEIIFDVWWKGRETLHISKVIQSEINCAKMAIDYIAEDKKNNNKFIRFTVII